eukprot:gene11417-7921_t
MLCVPFKSFLRFPFFDGCYWGVWIGFSTQSVTTEMFIKNIIINGFRSYREQVFPEGFSPRTNVIVGKNGSGKSNFFAAIQFVLSEKYVNLSSTEKKELFHMGSGKSSLSVYVEIIFDNSDGRLVIPGRGDEKEVRIRRTVGLKQDEFRVNDRKFSATEVRQLLESAGFSSSNPYNIVEQGKITNLANMSEQNRFQLIKDVAGTKVYEDRRDESKKILHETSGKLAQVDQSIQKLDDRIKELENDTKELKEYQHMENEKKMLEFSIFKSELNQIKKELSKCDEEWRNHLKDFNNERDKDGSVEGKITSCTARIGELNAQIQSLEQEKSTMEKEMGIANSKQAIAELDANSAASQKTRDQLEHEALEKERLQLSKSVAETTESLTAKKKMVQSTEDEAKRVLEFVNKMQRTVDSLQERRNRSNLFKNKKERDAWILNEINTKKETIIKASREMHEIEQQILEVDNELTHMHATIKSSTKSAEGSEKELLKREKEILAAAKKRDELNQERRKLWQEIHEQEGAVRRARDAADTTRQQYERSVRNDIRQGLTSLNEILQELNDPSLSRNVKGTVIDIIAIHNGFAAAVDATAGNALFNVVVDSFSTSAFLLEQMNKKRKPGRLTFFPLDTCRGVAHHIPTTDEVFPLVAKISAEDAFTKVVDEIFGRTAVVASLEAGARLVKELGCDAVTVEGDQLGRKGGITGGFIDNRKLKLVTYGNMKSAVSKHNEERRKLDLLCQEVAVVEQKITEALNELESLRGANVSVEQSTDAAIREGRMMEERLAHLRAHRQRLELAKSSLATVIQDSKDSIAYLEKEATEEFKAKWSAEDEERLHESGKELTGLKEKYLKVQTILLQLSTETQLQEDTIAHIQRRITVVDDRLRELGRFQRVASELNHERVAVSAEYSMLKDRLNAIERNIEISTRERDELESQLQTLSANRLSVAKSLEESNSVLLRIESSRSLLHQRQEEIIHKIRRLGVTSNATSQYQNHSIVKLMGMLKQVNSELQKFSHVNRKALDQHNTVLQSRNELDSQRQTLLDELKSINELLDHLENEKDEVIERTYKQIQFQFEEVFRELVGKDDCSAQLLLVKPRGASSPHDYSGARMRVSFGSSTGASDLEHLSGGQKSLVAIALVFAIQRCDPAPFYLFDEIDAALDAEYRAAVASMVERQSKDCQFIFTTFKSEMLRIADKVLAIFFHNKVTRIQSITPEEGEGRMTMTTDRPPSYHATSVGDKDSTLQHLSAFLQNIENSEVALSNLYIFPVVEPLAGYEGINMEWKNPLRHTGSVVNLTAEQLNHILEENEKWLAVSAFEATELVPPLIKSQLSFQGLHPSAASSDSAVSALHEKGRVTMKTSAWAEIVAAVRPAITLCPHDAIPLSETSERKRKTATMRNDKWETFASTLSLESKVLKSDTGCLESEEGFFVDSLPGSENLREFAVNLQQIRRKRPRSVCMCMANSFPQFLVALENNVSFIESSFPWNLAQKGIAIVLPSSATTTPQRNEALLLDLHDHTYKLDISPLQDGCNCFTCSRHTRAYVHHLLSVQEMNSPILLVMHNLSVLVGIARRYRNGDEKTRKEMIDHLSCPPTPSSSAAARRRRIARWNAKHPCQVNRIILLSILMTCRYKKRAVELVLLSRVLLSLAEERRYNTYINAPFFNMIPMTRWINVSLLVVAALCFCIVGAAAPITRHLDGIDQFNCLANEVYNPIKEICRMCPEHATTVDGRCECSPGYAFIQYAGAQESICFDCASQNKAVSPVPGINGSYFCVDCGVNISEPLGNAFFNNDTKKCECSPSFSLVTSLNREPLVTQVCIPCTTENCARCDFPYQTTADGSCECVEGYTMMFDRSCALTSVYEQMVEAAKGTTITYSPPNMDGSGSVGPTFTFAYTRERIIMAATLCLQGRDVECQFLTNMCVLMNYNKETTPCALYLQLELTTVCSDGTTTCYDNDRIVPWLYYVQSSAEIISSFRFKMKAWENLNFVVSTYDVEGNWLGLKPLVNEMNQCHEPNPVVETFMKAGGTLVMDCYMNWKWFLTAEPTHFYEIFMINPTNSSDLVPIPVLVDFSNQKFAPKTLLDPFFYRSGWTLDDTNSPYFAQKQGYRRRFYVYDNLATRAAATGPTLTLARTVTTAQDITLVIGSSFQNGASVPFFVLRYISRDVTAYLGQISQLSSQLPLASTSSSETVKEEIRMVFLGYSDTIGKSLMWSMIGMCCLSTITALFRTYGYMRRRQNLVLDVPAISVFVVYLLDHAANTFLFVAVVISWTLLVMYKSQHWLVLALREKEVYLTALIAASVAMKGIVVAYRMVEQCNADYYIIDWERSKGQLLRENSLVPVSMWRSNFLAHQLNRVQCMRYLHPLVVMICVSFFLIGFRYINLSKGVPFGSRFTTDSAITIETLRIALDTFFWCSVSFILYMLEFQVYYRFIIVHPLQAFVDLCSVSNISVLILLEPMWGFYIHGRSIHAHADVDMTEFQRNLSLEAEGNLPVRGLGGQSQCQTFEVFLGPYMRQYLYMCQIEMKAQHKKDGAIQTITNPAAWHVLECLATRKSEVYSDEAMAIKDQVNQALQRSIHRAEGSLFSKMALHRLLHFPPNIMYMNGAQRGDKGSKDLFFFDKDKSFEQAFMCNLDFDLFMLYTGLFALIDSAFENVFIAVVVTCILEFLCQMYRHKEGKSNFCSKTLINECFL